MPNVTALLIEKYAISALFSFIIIKNYIICFKFKIPVTLFGS